MRTMGLSSVSVYIGAIMICNNHNDTSFQAEVTDLPSRGEEQKGQVLRPWTRLLAALGHSDPGPKIVGFPPVVHPEEQP